VAWRRRSKVDVDRVSVRGTYEVANTELCVDEQAQEELSTTGSGVSCEPESGHQKPVRLGRSSLPYSRKRAKDTFSARAGKDTKIAWEGWGHSAPWNRGNNPCELTQIVLRGKGIKAGRVIRVKVLTNINGKDLSEGGNKSTVLDVGGVSREMQL